MTKRKFYKTVIQVEVLSEVPLGWFNVEQVANAINLGDCSGSSREVSRRKLNGRQAAKALLEQGSDPGFFRLTEAGEDCE